MRALAVPRPRFLARLRLKRWIWDPRLAAALALAFLYHGALLASGTFRRTYDAYVHMFFADHYARGWFDLWEPRWYTGFTVTSYPPGSHQLIALIGKLIGLEAAFVVVQTAAVLILVVGVYRFAQLWVSHRAAGYAALIAVVSTAIAETIHVFGQLPTILALGLLLNATPSVHWWMADGGTRHLVRALATLAATTAVHHVTTLFGAVFFLGPVMAMAAVAALRRAAPHEPAGQVSRVTRTTLVPLVIRRLRRVLPTLGRALVLMVGTAAVLAIVVLPYWLWSRSDPITQIPIPHSSRDSFIDNPNAGLMFWIVPWGLLLPALPWLVVRTFRSQAWPVGWSLAFIALLGTGGTTPIPRLLLGGAFEILTLDRFTFWASIMILPAAGKLVDDWFSGGIAPSLENRVRSLVSGGVVALALAVSFLTANLAELRTFQPDPIDPDPIVTFLEKDQHSRWRYLTLGFGDQMAWLSAQTTAQSVDGNYHSARRLPELITTPVERLEGAKFRGVPGLGSLQQFLTVPERYHLKFVFSNDTFYDPLLAFSGWHRLRRLENGIVVWERGDIPPLPAVADPGPEVPVYQQAMWGLLPMTALLTAALVSGADAWLFLPRRSRRLFGWWQRLDGILLQHSVVADDGGPARDWHLWRHRFPRRPNLRPVILLAGVLAMPAWLSGLGGPADAVEEQIEGYYEDLDFRRFRQAWERLDSASRLDYDGYLLQLSVEDGLVASYSMLDSVEVEVVSMTGASAEAIARLSYVTALSEYRIEERVRLRRVDGAWLVVCDPADPAVPAEPFIRRASVDYRSQLRRQVTTGTTAYSDVLDRPELAIVSARTVEVNDRLAVVGEVMNLDVDPADLTVRSDLLDAEGEVLASYNAGTAIAHKLLPLETTPFRIDFQGVAGAVRVDDPAAGSFRPDAFSPPTVDGGITAAAVSAKGLVTGTDLDRDLVAQNLVVAADASSLTLAGELFNVGAGAVTVPHVLVTMYADDGTVAWVDEFHLDQAVRPGRGEPFSFQLTPAARVEAVDVPVSLFDNRMGRSPAPTRDEIPLPAGSGYRGLRITTLGFASETT